MPITPTTCFTKIAQLKKPVRVIQGGSHASKTWSVLLYLIYYALPREILVSVVMESVPALSRSAYKDFQDILKLMNIYDSNNHNLTTRKYQLEKSTFQFISASDSDSLRGGRQNVSYFCEANNISFESFMQVSSRTHDFSILCYNPSSPFWAHSELIGESHVDYIKVTFEDNEFLNQKTLDEIERWKVKSLTSDYWLNYYKVYGLGELGIQEGSIIKDFSEIDSLPQDAQLIGSGLDFGYQDPTTLVSVYRYNGELIVDEKIYEKGLLNSQIAARIKNTDAVESAIYADSAEPKSIAELKGYGLPVFPVVKGKDSINYGLSLIQEQPLKVTSNSINLIKELQNYTWKKDKEGNSLNVPIDSYNHAIDALRYLFLMKFSNRSTTFGLKWKR